MTTSIPTSIVLPSGNTVDFYDVIKGADMGDKQWDYQLDLEEYILADKAASTQVANIAIREIAYRHLIKKWSFKDAEGNDLPTPTKDFPSNRKLSLEDLNALWTATFPLWQWVSPFFEPTTESEEVNLGDAAITESDVQGDTPLGTESTTTTPKESLSESPVTTTVS
jgi:hypothetical protein